MTKTLTVKHLAATHQAAFTQTRAWEADEFESLLTSPLVFATGDARCFALVRVIADEAELLTIATHPDYQRQGLASLVMENWQAQAATKGTREAFLEVAADNTAACALYMRFGYDIVATRAEYYRRSDGTICDAIVMKRVLSAHNLPDV
ncbi:GNAT family N-acetyltransferase [Epibacterium ulvae]|uniref:GNAT family N-acetyltransferase n=1 Tax=Epibacterium ulvae TaxID=1156985 RepID=UPI001BFC2853|nr:GNAT family N-acetyltransferase [Epibacterium ulvae]MBT8154025.1 GNAT family N-acetyltransferase [Epibacterium ulvae]